MTHLFMASCDQIKHLSCDVNTVTTMVCHMYKVKMATGIMLCAWWRWP